MQIDATEQVRLKPSDVVSRRQNKFSMMPEDLINGLSTQQVVDLLKFLMTLKEQPTSGNRQDASLRLTRRHDDTK